MEAWSMAMIQWATYFSAFIKNEVDQFQTAFGDEIVLKYELDRLACKSFVLLIAVEFAKLAYIRVGIELWFDKIVTYLIADWKGYAYTGRLNGTCFRRV